MVTRFGPVEDESFASWTQLGMKYTDDVTFTHVTDLSIADGLGIRDEKWERAIFYHSEDEDAQWKKFEGSMDSEKDVEAFIVAYAFPPVREFTEDVEEMVFN